MRTEKEIRQVIDDLNEGYTKISELKGISNTTYWYYRISTDLLKWVLEEPVDIETHISEIHMPVRGTSVIEEWRKEGKIR